MLAGTAQLGNSPVGKKYQLTVNPRAISMLNKGKVNRNLIYQMISNREIPSIKLGTKKLLIPSNVFDLIAEPQAGKGHEDGRG